MLIKIVDVNLYYIRHVGIWTKMTIEIIMGIVQLWGIH